MDRRSCRRRVRNSLQGRNASSQEGQGQEMTCRNICERIGIEHVFHPYEIALKYCRRCETFFDLEGYHCPCCGLALRTTPALKGPSACE
ncbi:MAG: hypothetical protein E6L03_10890 [Thaumarchaeota archaeon]|nr:MAG: hypothetical protein E6L03_10890 [Nitrososphaerota archaeon]